VAVVQEIGEKLGLNHIKYDPRFSINTKAASILDKQPVGLGYTKDVIERSRSPLLKIS
jgi:hypothetical protein